jgi:hypothetical protein
MAARRWFNLHRSYSVAGSGRVPRPGSYLDASLIIQLHHPCNQQHELNVIGKTGI